MGVSQSWIAVKTEFAPALLKVLNLVGTAERSECFFSCDTSFAEVKNGWTIVVRDHDGKPFYTEQPDLLRNLSRSFDLIAGSLEEHVMYSSCSFWHNGDEVWSVEHNADKGLRHLQESGKLPEFYSEKRKEFLSLQDGADDTDYVIEIPLSLTYEICGYATDRDLELNSEEPFERLESSGEAKSKQSRQNSESSKKGFFSQVSKIFKRED